MDGVLREIHRVGITAVGYVDDIAILTRGPFEEVLMDLVQIILEATD